MSKTSVLVVIPTLNESAHIEQVLATLLEDRAVLDLSIVVVDGGSTDGTQSLVDAVSRRHREVRLMHNPRRIQSSGINLAVRRYGRDAEVLIRCDAHAIYPEGYCRKLVDTLERTGADSVVVPMDSLGKAPFQRAVAWVSNSPVGTGGSAHRAGRQSGFVDHGHHAAFRMSMFRACGGYDDSFTHNEDAELDCRQRALGARIYLDSEIRLGYHPRDELRSLFMQYFKYGAGRSRTVRRHPTSLRLRQLAVPGHLVLSVISLLTLPLSPWLLIWPAIYLSVLGAFAVLLCARHRDLCALWSSVAALVMHTAWALGFFVGLVNHRERVWMRDMAVPLRLQVATGAES
ncbi:MAG TPA: glycosyltransferase family 2 protein [Polyangiaceae bacterium]|nr:glycosyltransferase family 2 protein [Polyangiaceae bacterium]